MTAIIDKPKRETKPFSYKSCKATLLKHLIDQSPHRTWKSWGDEIGVSGASVSKWYTTNKMPAYMALACKTLIKKHIKSPPSKFPPAKSPPAKSVTQLPSSTKCAVAVAGPSSNIDDVIRIAEAMGCETMKLDF